MLNKQMETCSRDKGAKWGKTKKKAGRDGGISGGA